MGGIGKARFMPPIVPPGLHGFNWLPLADFGQKKPRLPVGKRGLLVSFERR